MRATSRTRNATQASETHAATFEIAASIFVSRLRRKTTEENVDSTVTIAYPMMMQLTRNSSGSQGVNQSACMRGPGSSIIVPSEDWCIVGSSRPSASSQGRMALMNRRPVPENDLSPSLGLVFHFSKRAGESSSTSTSM